MKADSSDNRVPSFIQFTDASSSKGSSKRRSPRLVKEQNSKKRKTQSISSSRQKRIPLKENDSDTHNVHQQISLINNDDQINSKNAWDTLNNNDLTTLHIDNKADEEAKENDSSALGHSNNKDTTINVNLDSQYRCKSNRKEGGQSLNHGMSITSHKPVLIDTMYPRHLEFNTITISPNHGHQTIISPPLLPPPPPSLLTTTTTTTATASQINSNEPSPTLETTNDFYTKKRTDHHLEQVTPSPPPCSDDDVYYSAEEDNDWALFD